MSNLVIHGVRRSGTTILWETFRSDPALRCYDEPFHPRLAAGARANHNGTWTEFATDIDRLPTKPAPILSLQELETGATPDQMSWLAALAELHPRVVIDIVRGWNRLPDLHMGVDRGVGVHLIRSPASWVAAHLVPSAKPTIRRRVGNIYRRATFFTRKGAYNGYKYQQIIEAGLAANHPVFRYVRPTVEELSRAPAYQRLLAFWWGANITLAKGLSRWGQPVVTTTLEAFTADPLREVGRIAYAAGWRNLNVSTGQVQPVSSGFSVKNRQWATAVAWLGIPADLLGPNGCDPARLQQAFATADQELSYR